MHTNWGRTEDRGLHGLGEFRKLQDLKCAPPIRDIRDIRGFLSLCSNHEWTRIQEEQKTTDYADDTDSADLNKEVGREDGILREKIQLERLASARS